MIYHASRLKTVIVALWYPCLFQCSPGESKQRVQKLKNTYSNHSAPSKDVAKKVLKTELARHVFEGGSLNLVGTDFASELVLEEAASCEPFRSLLGRTPTKPAAGERSYSNIAYCINEIRCCLPQRLGNCSNKRSIY
jgi:hypothetical protein